MATFIVENTNDSGAGSLRQAILDSNAAGGDNRIEFDASLMGQTITLLTALPLSTNAVIDDGANNVTLSITQDVSLFTLENNVTLDTSVDIYFDIPDDVNFASTRGAISVTGDDASFINRGEINTSGVPGTSGDRLNSIQVGGDDFTLQNLGANASIISTGRSAIDVIRFGDSGFIDTTATVINEGFLEAADDTVRLTNGSVTNSGTIRTAATFNFGGNSSLEPGEIADAIIFFGPQSDNFTGDASLVTNLETGLIEGARSGIFFIGGGELNNFGTITAEVTAISSQTDSFQSLSSEFIINNSGTITRLGENFGFNGNEAITSAAILVGEGYENATITNAGSGVIASTDLAISAFEGTTFINSGVVISDSDGVIADGIGPDGMAFRGRELNDFAVNVSISFTFPNPDQVLENAQGITVDMNGGLVIPDIGVFTPPAGQVEVALTSAGNLILPLVDLTATEDSGELTFQSDANGLIFPATIDVISPNLGVLTVTYVSGDGFTVTDSNGDPVFNVPSDVDYADTITNDGTINGDINTGLGDDVVTNSGVIQGDISLGTGDDMFTSTSSVSSNSFNIDAGSGDDVINAGIGNDSLFGGSGDDMLNGGAGDDTAIYNLQRSDYTIVENTNGSFSITDDVGAEGIDTLTDIEFAQFSDIIIDLGAFVPDTNLSADDDSFTGTNGADIINGLGGNDTLFGT